MDLCVWLTAELGYSSQYIKYEKASYWQVKQTYIAIIPTIIIIVTKTNCILWRNDSIYNCFLFPYACMMSDDEKWIVTRWLHCILTLHISQI